MWVDLDIQLRKQINGDLMVMTDANAIINSMRNISQTLQGQRRMLPEFAMPLYKLLFEPVDEQTAYKIGNYLIESIQAWDNRINLTDVLVEAETDANRYNVTCTFNVKTSNTQPVSFQFILMQQG